MRLPPWQARDHRPDPADVPASQSHPHSHRIDFAALRNQRLNDRGDFGIGIFLRARHLPGRGSFVRFVLTYHVGPTTGGSLR